MRYSFESRCRVVQAILVQGPVAPGRPRSWRQPRHHLPLVVALPRRGDGPLTLASKLGRAASTVGKVLRRATAASRRPRVPRPEVVRHERARTGELLHVDIKKLGRCGRWGSAVDDHSRLAYAEVLPSERATDAVAFLGRAPAWYRGEGVEPEAVLTDNGFAYRAHRWRDVCGELGLRHLRTRPYTPHTNGKAERFIQTMLTQWAYRYLYPTRAHRARALPGWCPLPVIRAMSCDRGCPRSADAGES